MPIMNDALAAARERIAAAYDPRLFDDAGHRLADLLAANLERAEHAQGAVLPWADPPRRSPKHGPAARRRDAAGRRPLLAARRGRCSAAASTCTIPATSVTKCPLRCRWPGLFDAVGSVTNQVMAIYEMGPWATAVEQAMVRRAWARRIGWEPEFLRRARSRTAARSPTSPGCSRPGMSLSVTPGTAGWRRRATRPVLLAHADSHYSVARAAGILGLGSRQIVRVGLDDRGRMDPNRLDAELRTNYGPRAARSWRWWPARAPPRSAPSTRLKRSPTFAAGMACGCTSTRPMAGAAVPQ